MSSEEIIQNIIKEIVVQSSSVLKTQFSKNLDPEPAVVSIQKEASVEKQDASLTVDSSRKSTAGSQQQQQSSSQGEPASRPRSRNENDIPAETDDDKTEDDLSTRLQDVAHLHEYQEPRPPTAPLPEHIRHMFVSGIKSHIAPFHVTETLAAFVIRSVVLDPKLGFQIEQPLGREDVHRLIEVSTKLITSSQDIVMETIRMQVYFDTNFPAQKEFLHKEKLTRVQMYAPLLREILETKTKGLQSYEALYRKIVQLVLIKGHVGKATDVRIVREATAALESVFPQSELNGFASLARNEKEAQLSGLSQLVTGIRLFNKQLGKGGESIENLPELCGAELRELTLLLHEHTSKTEQLIQLYKSVLDYADSTPNSEISPEEGSQIRNALIFRRQYLIYLDALQEQVISGRKVLVDIAERFDESMRELRMTCKAKTAVPVDQVYPHFITLSNVWTSWTDELFLLAFRRGIVDQLNYHANRFHVEISPLVVALSERFKAEIEPEILPEITVIQRASETMVVLSSINKEIDVLHPGNTTQYYRLPVEFGGFCPVALLNRDTLIVPGDKNLGLLKYRDKLYVCSTIAYVKEFAKSPDRFIFAAVEEAKSKPHLVQLLQLHNYFPTVEALEKARSYTRQRLLGQIPMVAEMGCQVDTHIVDEHIDTKYKWNEWDLRRHALMLANMKNKKTHSVQTHQSHFRRDSETQHYPQRHGETQTKRSSHTNVPKTVRYLGGLRNSGVPIPNGLYVSPFSPRKSHFQDIDLSIDHDGGPVPYAKPRALPSIQRK